MKLSSFAEYYLVEKPWEKSYNYLVDLFVQMRGLFEHMSPSDLYLMSELPYPLFNDILLKQIEENKKQQQRLNELKSKQSTNVVRKKR